MKAISGFNIRVERKQFTSKRFVRIEYGPYSPRKSSVVKGSAPFFRSSNASKQNKTKII